jgi:hypothetical protein
VIAVADRKVNESMARVRKRFKAVEEELYRLNEMMEKNSGRSIE